MKMSRKSIIWTTHALTRLKERKIEKHMIELTINHAQRVSKINYHTIEFQRDMRNQTLVAIGKENIKGELIILTCWINPPNSGTRDFKRRARYFQIKHASFGKKIWLTFLNAIGL